jgi:hypothetical protein
MNCNKKAFGSKSHAKKYAANAEERFRIKFVVYKCPICESFHLAKDKSSLMSVQDTLQVLNKLNQWRTDRDGENIEMPEPKDITKALSSVTHYLNEFIKRTK